MMMMQQQPMMPQQMMPPQVQRSIISSISKNVLPLLSSPVSAQTRNNQAYCGITSLN